MTAKWQRPAYTRDQRQFSAQEALAYAYSVDRDGAVETAYAQAEELVKRLAELAARLHEKGVLSDADISYLLAGHFDRVSA